MNDDLKRTCSCCGEEKEVSVTASSLGAFSFAYCADCLTAGVEPYGALVSYIACAGNYPEDINPRWLDFIKHNLEFYDKTEEQFKNDVMKANEEMNQHFRQMASQANNQGTDF